MLCVSFSFLFREQLFPSFMLMQTDKWIPYTDVWETMNVCALMVHGAKRKRWFCAPTCMQNVNIYSKVNELIKQAGVEWMWKVNYDRGKWLILTRHVEHWSEIYAIIQSGIGLMWFRLSHRILSPIDLNVGSGVTCTSAIGTINLIRDWSKISGDRMSRGECFGIFEVYVWIHIDIDSSLQSVSTIHIQNLLNRPHIQKTIMIKRNEDNRMDIGSFIPKLCLTMFSTLNASELSHKCRLFFPFHLMYLIIYWWLIGFSCWKNLMINMGTLSNNPPGYWSISNEKLWMESVEILMISI